MSAAPLLWVRDFNQVSRVDLADDSVTPVAGVHAVERALAVHPNADLVYVESSIDQDPLELHRVTVVNGTTGQNVAVIDMTGFVRSLAVNRAGTRVYAAKRQGKIAVIDTSNNSVITHDVLVPTALGFSIEGITVLPSGAKVYAAVVDSNIVGVVNAATNTVTSRITVGSGPYGVAATPDSTKVYVTVGNSIKVINTATDTLSATVINLASNEFPRWLTVNPAGTRVFAQVVTDTAAQKLAEIDVASNSIVRRTVITSPPSFAAPTGIASSTDGSQLYWLGPDGVIVINAADHSVVKTIAMSSGASAKGEQFIKPPCAGCCS